jgi:hypothetical protein
MHSNSSIPKLNSRKPSDIEQQSHVHVYGIDASVDINDLNALTLMAESDPIVIKYRSNEPNAIPGIDYPEEYCKILPELVLNALYHCKR